MSQPKSFSFKLLELPALDALSSCEHCYRQMGEHYLIESDGKEFVACPRDLEAAVASSWSKLSSSIVAYFGKLIGKTQTHPVLQLLARVQEKKTLSEEDVLKLSGFHPKQPFYFEVDHSQKSVGYRVVKYNAAHQEVESTALPNMPKYLVQNEKLKIQIKANYEWMMNQK
jgi:hypothetical protein